MSNLPDNTLSYVDQAQFAGLRALGRWPVLHYIWIYENDFDLDGLRRFHRNLQHTLLGRLIERSPLPFGRHRWVTYDGPADIEIAVSERRREEVWDWVDERSFLPIDPELGPPWRLGVQPLVGGGAAVALAFSHVTGDAVAGAMSIVAAVDGAQHQLGFPPPGSRSLGQALREDLAVTARSVRDISTAASASSSLVREEQIDLTTTSARAGSRMRRSAHRRPVVMPRVFGCIDAKEWDTRARALGGTPNVLLAGFATRVGYRLGRVGGDGRAMVWIPVSHRTEGDTRANPLSSIFVYCNPDEVTQDLVGLRAAVKQALIDLGDPGDTASAGAEALTPFIPKFVLRRLSNSQFKLGKPIGCSNVGALPEAANRPDGSEADFFGIRGGEAELTESILEMMGGHNLVSAATLRGKVWFSVASWEVGRANTKAELIEVVGAALDDFGLAATLE
ncbi:MAG: hypothetical protein KDB55_08065 [Mycobacterium sp.]|nr:hypothetical protein [Mycobacterium sp.]